MVELTGINKTYDTGAGVRDISFKVKKGEILGLLGANGAGKTTVMNIISGYLLHDSGRVRIAGEDSLENPEKTRALVGYLPEEPPLYREMTVEEYLKFVCELKKINGDRDSHLGDIIAKTGLAEHRGRLIGNLSKGYKQRVGFAQALVGNPPVIILDEPTSGFDPKQAVEIRELIKQLSGEQTIILSSHILSEVRAVCERIVVLADGCKVADDTPENLEAAMTAGKTLSAEIAGDRGASEKVLKAVKTLSAVKYVGSAGPGICRFELESESDARTDVFYALAAARLPLVGMRSVSLSLEQVFLELTAPEHRPQAAVPKKPVKTRKKGE